MSWCGGSTFPRARFVAISRRSTWPARSSARTAGRSAPARCVRCRPSTSAPARPRRKNARSAWRPRRLIEDGDTVLLDGGTTTLEVARALVGRRVQVVTNSLPIAQLLASNQQTELILIGGYVYPRTGVALGPLAIATMETIRVRMAVLGAGGVMPEGIYNSNSLLVETERQMMSCGQEIMIVADHTKFGRLALARLCGLEEVNQFVIDSGTSEENRALHRASRCGRSRGAGHRKPKQRGRARAGPRRQLRGSRNEHRRRTHSRAS